MLKGIGAVCILCGCMGLGLWYRSQFVGRLKTLRRLQQILDLWESEVRYGKATLGECCQRMEKQLSEPFRSCFQRLNQRLQHTGGESCGKIVQRTLREGMEGLPLKAEDKEAFLQFVPESGYMDGQMQLLAIQRSRTLLEHTIDRLEKENTEKCRMAVGLGVMSGMLLILVLW